MTAPAQALRDRARRCLEAYLRGLEQGGHPPLTPAELATQYAAILRRLASRGP